ncbi:MAG: hypothetical protein ACYCY3_09135 [Halothiobacillus sp.]
MDQQYTYTTTLTAQGLEVIIGKVARNACAYGLIKTHALGGRCWFFHGNIQVSFSNLADHLITTPACDVEHAGLEAYFAVNLTALPKGITLIPAQ